MVYLVKAYVVNKQRTYTIEADNIAQIPALLFEKTGAARTTILNIVPLSKHKSGVSLARLGRVKKEDLELFCRQMQVLVDSGITVLESIEILADQSENKNLKKALKHIAENVRAGFSLSASLGGFPQIFNPVFRNSIKAAEESGTLTETLGWLADNIRKEIELKSKIAQAIMYPLIVVGFSFLITIGLFTFVVPKFVSALKEGGVPLPLLTRIIIFISQSIHIFMAALAVGAVVSLLTLKTLRRNEYIFSKIEMFFLKIPLAGKIIKYANLARFFWTLTALVRAGIPMTETLSILAESSAYISLRNETYLAKHSVEKGNSLSSGFQGSAWMPSMYLRMIGVGEQSGKLDRMAEQASRLLEKQVDALLAKLPPFLEVSTTVAVGAVVLIVLLALFLPYVSIMQTIK